MRVYRRGEGCEIVTALKGRQDAALGVALCNAGDNFRQIGISRFSQAHTREGIVFVRINPAEMSTKSGLKSSAAGTSAL